MDAETELSLALNGARCIIHAGSIWEDEHGELWESSFVGWVNLDDAADRETEGQTHWQFYGLALAALFLAGEVHVHETAVWVTGDDGRKRKQVTPV